MSGEFMRIKKIVLPTLTVIMIASQLVGCAAVKQSELSRMLNESQQIEIEIAEPISIEQGEERDIEWVALDKLETYSEFRKFMDDIMKITPYGDGSKNGIAYIGLDGNQCGNNTIYNSMMNRKFVATFYDNAEALENVSKNINKVYADVDVSKSKVAAVNAYWNLLPDSEPNFFNGDSTLTRLEAMALIARAKTPASESIGDYDFENAVGNGEYAKYASLVKESSYLDVESKSLDEVTANNTITRAEYFYMVIKDVFGEDRIEKADTARASFVDTKNGGDIAKAQKLDESLDRAKSYELRYAVLNADDGVPEELYKALVAAKELGLVGEETRWDDGLTKAEAIEIYLKALEVYTSQNGYVVDSTSGIAEAVEEPEEYNYMEDVREEADKADEEIRAEEQEAEEEPEGTEEPEEETEEPAEEEPAEVGIEIVEELDKTMYTKSSCNVRNGDSTDYDKIGTYAWGEAVHVTGRTSKDWYRIEFLLDTGNTVEAYISGSLLVDEMPVSQPAPQQSSGNNSSGNTGGIPYDRIQQAIEALGGTGLGPEDDWAHR